MPDDEGEVRARIEVSVPEEVQAGTYANHVTVWHSPHEFTIDFAVTSPPVRAEDGVVVPATVVSRVKIPLTLVFDLLRTINHNMSRYEATYGDITQVTKDDGEV